MRLSTEEECAGEHSWEPSYERLRALVGAGIKGLKQGAEARRDLWQLLQRPEATLQNHVDTCGQRQHPTSFSL